MAATPTHLEYAHEPGRVRRRRIRRALTAAAVVLVVAVSTRWLAPAWGHAQLLYWQGKCLAYAPPGDYLPIDRGAHATSAPCWREFYARFSPPGRNALGTVFVHERRRPDGARRLVVVEAAGVSGNGASEVTLDYHVFDPATPWRRARLVANADVKPSFRHAAGDGAHFRINPGRPDPADPTHFTVDVRWRDRTVTLDGWLRADDTILLEPRERLTLLSVSN